MNSEVTVFASPGTKPPKLFAIWQGCAHEFSLSQRQRLGRPSSASRPELSVPVETVSRNHGEFTTDGGLCQYRDLGSTNGTLLNGKPLAAGQPQLLQNGDVLRIHGRNDKENELDVVMVYSTDYPENGVWHTISADSATAEISVGREEPTVLRGSTVSRRHASFFHAAAGWAIIDHGSLNGVFVNNKRLEKPAYLAPMDLVSIAGYPFLFTGREFIFRSDAPADETAPHTHKPEIPARPALGGAALSIYIEERNVWHRMKKQTLLKDIRLDIPLGSMVLILGGSGAGKTTFMNAVMGYEPAQGQILYKGTDIYDEYEKMKYEIGYVPQQDLLRMNDTVYATLQNAAQMRLPPRQPAEYYAERVEKTMHMLGLERERDSLVGKLSGGQRKRLSIAVEHIGNPSLFFLDEPDSGLDGTMARSLMENLRAIADDGRIVLLISHSPDRAFELFDRVIVLAKSSRDNSGHLVFTGSPSKALSFFEVNSLESIVKRINRTDEGGDGLADHYIDKFAAAEGSR